jgi:hypothetical protein
MNATAWTQDDLLINLTDELRAVKEFYNVPSLNHVPDCELTLVKYAQVGDLVHVKSGRVGICIDVHTCGGAEYVALLMDNGRVIVKSRTL